MKRIAFILAIGLLWTGYAWAGGACEAPKVPAGCETVTCGEPGCCAHCGSKCNCTKSCQIVCEMKDVKKVVWDVKCGDMCTLLPGCKHRCGCGDDNCGCKEPCKEGCQESCCKCGKNCNPCAALEKREYVPPKCGRIREVKTLEKKEVVCKVPSYKCVVTYSCGACSGSQGEKAPTAAPSDAAPAPAPAPKTTMAAPLPPVIGTSFAQ